MAEEKKETVVGNADNLSIEYDIDESSHMKVRFKVNGKTKLILPLKIVNYVAEEGGRRIDQENMKRRLARLSQSIKPQGFKKKE